MVGGINPSFHFLQKEGRGQAELDSFFCFIHFRNQKWLTKTRRRFVHFFDPK